MLSECEEQGGERLSCQVESENFCPQQVQKHLGTPEYPAEISIWRSLLSSSG